MTSSERGRRWRERNPEKIREYDAQATKLRRATKEEIITAYGGKCACCGETILGFLTLDHIADDGAQHRREVKHHDIYRWIRRLGYLPDGLQVMCWNCNCGRAANGGVCPHSQQPVAVKPFIPVPLGALRSVVLPSYFQTRRSAK